MDASGRPPKWFVVFERTGRALIAEDTVYGWFENAFRFLVAVILQWEDLLGSVDMCEVGVFASRAAFYRREPPLTGDASIFTIGNTIATPIFVVIPVLPAPSHGPSEVVVFGSYKSWFVDDQHGVDVDDELTTLRRSAKTRQMISFLDRKRVMMVTSPPMTGKTSLAALMCHDLETRERGQRVVIAAFSFASVRDDETVFEAFERECEIDWDDVVEMGAEGYTVYIFLDEAQRLDEWNQNSPPLKESDTLWRQISGALRQDTRVLLLATYASHIQYGGHEIYIQLSHDHVLRVDRLSFNPDELQAYVAQCFAGFASLGKATGRFCELLKALTGAHTGLCVSTIRALNIVHKRHSGYVSLTARDWLDILQTGQVDGRSHALLDALAASRAVNALERLWCDVGGSIQKLIRRENWGQDEPVLNQCVRSGIMVRTAEHLDFASPVMWRSVVKKCISRAEETLDPPATLEDLVARIVDAMDYSVIRRAFHPFMWGSVALERMWQMEFYNAVYRSTPPEYRTSVDLGEPFGSPGCLELTVRSESHVWGIDWVRRGESVDDHVARFTPTGLYAPLNLTDHCLIRFMEVEDEDEARMEQEVLVRASNASDKLYLICHNAWMTKVDVWHRGAVWRQPYALQTIPQTSSDYS